MAAESWAWSTIWTWRRGSWVVLAIGALLSSRSSVSDSPSVDASFCSRSFNSINSKNNCCSLGASASVEYEPDEEELLADLLPRNVAVQLLRAQRENAASEQGSKMTAMDNATRNAGDMINKLTIQYNRTRQAAITTELVEIISGAEAL